MSHVATVGPIPNDFLDHLKTAGYTYTVNKAYSSSILNSDEPPVAIALHGSNTGLASTEEIISLLNTRAILLLFSPSLALLEVLGNAISAVIDIPRIKFEENVPLIVFKMQAIDHFCIIPGFSQSALEILPSETHQSILLGYSVNLIGKCVTYASDPVALRNLANGRGLVPPPQVKWCKTKGNTVIIVNKKYEHDVSLLWAAQIFAYATGYPPKQSETVVYTVILHSGSFNYDGFLPGSFIKLSTSMGESGGLLERFEQLPAGPASEIQKIFHHEINFSKQVTLFEDEMTPTPWELFYQLSYPLIKVKQTSTLKDLNMYQFDYESSEGYYGHQWEKLPLHGLTAWTSPMGNTTLDCKVEYKVRIGGGERTGSDSNNIPLDLVFRKT